MNYQQSKLILSAIKKAKNILLNIHPHPDLDSIGGALAVKQAINLIDKEKKVMIISPEKIKQDFSFFGEAVKKIKVIDFLRFNFSSFDLFLILDASSDDRVTGAKEIFLPKKIEKIVIDHHLNNKIDAKLKIIDEKACATTEILFKIFLDWGIKINKNLATLILAGIVGDTVFFRYLKDYKKQWLIVQKLLDLGADIKMLRDNYFSYSLPFLQFLGDFLRRLKVERAGEKKFVWAAMSFFDYQSFGMDPFGQSFVADLFLAAILGVDFGFLVLEKEKGKLSLSFRSKPYFNVAKIAQNLGGGGHKNAAGATIKIKKSFAKEVEEIVKKVKESV